MHWCCVTDVYMMRGEKVRAAQGQKCPSASLASQSYTSGIGRGEKGLWCPLGHVKTLMLCMSEVSFVILSHKEFG